MNALAGPPRMEEIVDREGFAWRFQTVSSKRQKHPPHTAAPRQIDFRVAADPYPACLVFHMDESVRPLNRRVRGMARDDATGSANEGRMRGHWGRGSECGLDG